jgi:hypothetical protein
MQLRQIEARNLFLTPLDHQRQWYRYHALYREFLLGELRRTEPGIMMTLHQRAADWYESNGSPALALEQLLHTDDWDRSVRLTAKLVLPTYMAALSGSWPTRPSVSPKNQPEAHGVTARCDCSPKRTCSPGTSTRPALFSLRRPPLRPG